MLAEQKLMTHSRAYDGKVLVLQYSFTRLQNTLYPCFAWFISETSEEYFSVND